MNKTYQTAVVLVPPKETWTPIQAIRREHDRHFRRWMPHITLLYPFRPRKGWADTIVVLRQACQGIQAFGIELATFRIFQHRNSFTVWLAPEPQAEILALQSALWHAVPDCDDTCRHVDGFTPHLSVGQVSGRDRVEKLVTELQANWTPVRFWASAVQLIWRADPPDDVFRIGEQIDLAANV